MSTRSKSLMSRVLWLAPGIAALFLWASSAAGAAFFFSTGNPDGLMATASRPDSAGQTEIESADDFVLSGATTITGATFTGLVPLGSTAIDVTIEIYRVFPKDSTVPPSGQVPSTIANWSMPPSTNRSRGARGPRPATSPSTWSSPLTTYPSGPCGSSASARPGSTSSTGTTRPID